MSEANSNSGRSGTENSASGSGSGSSSDSDSSSASSASSRSSRSVKNSNTRSKSENDHHLGGDDSASGSGSDLEPSRKSKRDKKSSSSGKKPKQVWDENPDMYGIRRSGRSRKEPERYNIVDEESDESGSKKKKTRRRRSTSNQSSFSDSDSDNKKHSPKARPPPRRPVKSSKRKVQTPSRKGRRLSSSEDSSDYESDSGPDKRESLRKSKSSVSYKEQSAEETGSEDLIEMEYPAEEVEAVAGEGSETVERILDHRMGKKGAVGDTTTVYTVEDMGDPNDPNAEEKELQFLIKWKDWSHLHNTWESETSLRDRKVKGLKKMENYHKKEEALAEWRRNATPEDIEYHAVQQEMTTELMIKYTIAERIIAHAPSKNGDSTDYLVKWDGLPYSDCTWEDESLTKRKFRNKVDEYFDRLKSQKIPTKACKVLKLRPKFLQLKKQPEYIGGENNLELRDYQLDGLNWLGHSWCKA